MLATSARNLVHGDIIREVFPFLETNMLIPEQLFIQGNGWVEAHFRAPVVQVLRNLEAQNVIELKQPVQELKTAHGIPLVIAKFRVKSQQSFWHRVKQLFS
jgi:hypothetical protein